MVWSPIEERVDRIDSVSVNGIWMEGPEQRELLGWISRMMGEQEMSLSGPDLGRRDLPASRGRATYEHDIGLRGGIGGRSGMRPRLRGPGECPVYEVVRHGPASSEPDLRLLALREQDLKQVELHLREHPPRDFRRGEGNGGLSGLRWVHRDSCDGSESDSYLRWFHLVARSPVSPLHGTASQPIRLSHASV